MGQSVSRQSTHLKLDHITGVALDPVIVARIRDLAGKGPLSAAALHDTAVPEGQPPSADVVSTLRRAGVPVS